MNLDNRYRIKELFVAYVKGKLDEDSRKELEVWLNEDEEHKRFFERMTSRSYFDRSVARFVKNDKDAEEEWRGIAERTFGRGKRKFYVKVLRYAAIVVVPLLCVVGVFSILDFENRDKELFVAGGMSGGARLMLPSGEVISLSDLGDDDVIDDRAVLDSNVLVYREVTDKKAEFHKLMIPRGGEFNIVLSDGTRVYLNAESEIEFPTSFRGYTREVRVKGEVYFDVKHDEDRAFRVFVNDLEVEVLGTSFGIRAYDDEESVLTTLVTGKVRITAGDDTTVLTPGTQAVFNILDSTLSTKLVNTALYIGWKDGLLIFDNMELVKVMDELSRWYDVEVFWDNDNYKNIPFSLNVRKHEELERVLTLLEKTGIVSFEVNNNIIIIK